MIRLCLFAFLLSASLLHADNRSRVLFNSLDPRSIVQHLAFYELFPDTPEGQEALSAAWQLMTGKESAQIPPAIASAPFLFTGLSALISPQSGEPPAFTPAQLQAIDLAARRLANRKLKGHRVRFESEVVALPKEQIDLARGVFLSHLGDSEEAWQKILCYEAQLDLMALQIAARLPSNASAKDKIREINRLVFEEMGYRFPPHSLYAKDVDLYTFLPSVLDSRRGVCLGVSILYICLAQRLGLELEMITPPGHIYVRYRSPTQEINIETTARGIHIDSEDYLSVNTRSLQQRTVKEVIGMAHVNEASVYWQEGNYAKALAAYDKALPYLPDDKHVAELRGYILLLAGKEEEGRAVLEKVKNFLGEEEVAKDRLTQEILEGKVDMEGLSAVFMHVDDKRKSILDKKNRLENVLAKLPQFSTGYFQLATAWLQLHREGEALEVLEKYHVLNPTDPTAEYYLAVLWMQRLDYQQAWVHLRLAEELTAARNHHPKALQDLRRELARLSPE